jgi:hypothetical protein
MASRPLRISRHRVAVVRKGRAMSFVGRLTCLRGTRRVNAPSGTVVQIFRKIGSHATLQTGVALIPSGFRVLLAFASSRTVIFSYGSGASLRRVRIPVLVSRVSAQAVARR